VADHLGTIAEQNCDAPNPSDPPIHSQDNSHEG
jgi:hypothetical protein